MIEVVNNIAPLKAARIKNTSSEWFDREIAKKISIRDKLFKKFKSSRLNIDWEIYKETRNDIQRTIKQKKKQCYCTFIPPFFIDDSGAEFHAD